MTADSVTAGWLLRGSRIAQIINATITFIFDTNFEGDFRAILGRPKILFRVLGCSQTAILDFRAIFGRFLGFRSRRVVVKGDFMDFYLSRSGWRNE
jgi:hypothetical protein